MKNIVLFSIILALTTMGIKLFSKGNMTPLPNWIDTEREISDGNPPILYTSRQAPEDFRIPAEYEPVGAVVMGWMGYTSMLREIAEIVTHDAHAKVWNAEGPSSISGIPSEDYSKIDCYLDTVWMRDYGPFGISVSENKIGVVDTIYRHYQYRRDDDALPTCLAREKDLNAYGAEIILDGGNFLVDSHANLFMTKRTYYWNRNKSEEEVNRILKQTFNVKTIHALEYAGYPSSPGDGTGHIDMFVKLLSDNTVLISTADKEPFKSNGQKAIAYFESILSPDGTPYKIIEVKGWSSGRTWFTYTNSLIVNNVVIMPTYSGNPALNEAAKKAYENAMEGVLVRGVNSDSSIYSGGSIHCVTQTIPAI